jgi:hypothetical protein
MANVFAESFNALRNELLAELMPIIASEAAALRANFAGEVQGLRSRGDEISEQLDSLKKLVAEGAKQSLEAQQRNLDAISGFEKKFGVSQQEQLARFDSDLKAQRVALQGKFTSDLQAQDARGSERFDAVSKRVAELRERVSKDYEEAERYRKAQAVAIDQARVAIRMDLFNEMNTKLQSAFGDLDRRLTERIAGVEKRVMAMEQDLMAKLGTGLETHYDSLRSEMAVEMQALEKRSYKHISDVEKSLPDHTRGQLEPVLRKQGERFAAVEDRLAMLKEFAENLGSLSEERSRELFSRFVNESEALESRLKEQIEQVHRSGRDAAALYAAQSEEREKQHQETMSTLRQELDVERSKMTVEFGQRLEDEIRHFEEESSRRAVDFIVGLGSLFQTAASKLTVPVENQNAGQRPSSAAARIASSTAYAAAAGAGAGGTRAAGNLFPMPPQEPVAPNATQQTEAVGANSGSTPAKNGAGWRKFRSILPSFLP